MKLKKIELFGFKSFAERTKIKFEPGVTAIVGPNGCGKSNVADSIKWVLGEQRPTALRGTSMGDVIFNGTNQRDPINIAEVSLTLSNDTKTLPIDYDEVTVTRRLHRSGESEYLLNKTRVRLKDIQDLFHGTGVGTVSYSLIEQGKMDLVLSTKPDDRRFIFEEAAGITKYKSKKQEALRKLEHTETNLQRANDVINEVNRQIKSIERQARKAERYKEEFDKLKDLEIKNGYRKYLDLKNQNSSADTQRQDLKGKENSLSTSIREMDVRVEDERKTLGELEEKLSRNHSKKVEVNSTIEKNISKIELNKERCLELESRINFLKGQNASLEEKLSKLNGQIKEAKEELEGIESSTTQKNEELHSYEARLKALNEDIDLKNRQIREGKGELIDLVANETKNNNELAEIKANLQNINSRLRRLNIDKEDTLKEKEVLDEKKASLEAKHKNIAENLENLKQEKIQHQESLAQDKETFKLLKEEIGELEHIMTSLKSKLDFLKDLKERYEGYSNAVKALLVKARAQELPFRGINDSLANLIKVRNGFEICADAAISHYAQDIVIESSEDLKDALKYIDDNNLGRVNFLLLDEINSLQVDINEAISQRTLGPLANFIETHDKYSKIIKYLAKDVYVMENETQAKVLLDEIMPPAHVRFITKDGQIFSRARISGGFSHLSEETSLIGRDAKINNLQQDLNLKISETQQKKKLVTEKEEAIRILEDKVKSLEEIIHQEEIKRANLESEKSTVASDLRKFEDEVMLIDSEKDEAAEERDNLSRRQAEVEEEVARIKERSQSLNSLISENESVIEKDNQSIQNILVNLTQLRTELASIDKLYSNKADTCGVIERSIDEATKDLENNKSERSNSTAKIEELTKETSRLTEDNETLSRSLSEVESQLESISRKRNDILNALREHNISLRKKQEELNNLRNNLHTYEVKNTESSLKIENLTDRIYNAYQVRLSEVNPQIDDITNWQQIENEIEQLRNKVERMGPVNLVAIDEHQELRDRFEFLSHQRQDLEDAKDSLHKAIQKINRTTTTMFKETFEQIKVTFEEFFKLLFGGGSAKLYLVDERHVLESGIEIIARPPGKKLQNISLMSGGEKALCAVALLFAVFKVKPSPFCVLDEIDAPLDESNVVRFTRVLSEFIKTSQFIIITHNKRTINMADVMYGVTMEESGVSKIVSVKFSDSENSEPAAVA
jgi:chromosome segregation protein